MKCEICNQEHTILEQLEPVNKSIIDNLFNQNLFNKLMSKNKNFISDIDQIIDCFERKFYYMENLIDTRIESLKIELDHQACQLVSKINAVISKRKVLFKINEIRGKKKLKMNFIKIGYFSQKLNKRIISDNLKSKNIEEIIQKMCKICITPDH